MSEENEGAEIIRLASNAQYKVSSLSTVDSSLGSVSHTEEGVIYPFIDQISEYSDSG